MNSNFVLSVLRPQQEEEVKWNQRVLCVELKF